MSLLKPLTNLSLRTKFMAPFAFLLLGSIMVIAGYLIDRQAEGFHRELETSGETMARLLAMQAESGVLFESKYELDEVLKQLAGFDIVTYARIADKDGTVLAEIGKLPEGGLRRVRDIVRDNGTVPFTRKDYYVETESGELYMENSHVIVSRIEKLDRENLGITNRIDGSLARSYTMEDIGTITVILSLDKVNQAVADARLVAIEITMAVVIITILLIGIFIRIITNPVRMLVAVTDKVSRGDLSQRVDINQRDEIGRLAATFNRMIDSLKQSRDEIEEYNRNLEAMIVERTIELEKTQAQLVQSEKMSAIGQLAAGVAHELNNPLGGILGYAQFALEKLRKTAVDRTGQKEIDGYTRYLSDIEAQARRCKTIVQNLLRFSRASRTSDFEDVDINAAIKDTCTFVEHQLQMNQIELEIDLDPNLPVIQGNSGQLQQVFTNLIINAMHASPPDSTIRIRTGTSASDGEHKVEIRVIDEGIGIPPENMPRLFEPFFTTKEVGKGTGLGLSVSYGIIRDHTGEIKVESTPGQGTTFTVILPLQIRLETSDSMGKGAKPVATAANATTGQSR